MASPVIKTSGDKTKTKAQVTFIAQQAMLTEDSSCVVIGTTISTGALFMKRFATGNMLAQWLTTGDAADVDISRMTM
jgi:hypothetical protein